MQEIGTITPFIEHSKGVGDKEIFFFNPCLSIFGHPHCHALPPTLKFNRMVDEGLIDV